MKRHLHIFWSPAFIAALVLLLANDHWLKYEFHHWVTGKLSDVAGLFIFPIFFSAFLPRFKKHIYWITAIGFIFWKSPLSNEVINSWNQLHIFSVLRVIDYTDLIALLILPLSYFYFDRYKQTSVRLNPVPVIVLSSFAFMATSKGPERIEYKKNYVFNYSLDTLKTRIFFLEALATNYSYHLEKLHDLDSVKTDSSVTGYEKQKKLIIDEAVKDSNWIWIEDSFCNKANIEARIILGQGVDNRSFMYVEHLGHRCYEKDKTKKEEIKKTVIEIFEKKIIQPLQQPN